MSLNVESSGATPASEGTLLGDFTWADLMNRVSGGVEAGNEALQDVLDEIFLVLQDSRVRDTVHMVAKHVGSKGLEVRAKKNLKSLFLMRDLASALTNSHWNFMESTWEEFKKHDFRKMVGILNAVREQQGNRTAIKLPMWDGYMFNFPIWRISVVTQMTGIGLRALLPRQIVKEETEEYVPTLDQEALIEYDFMFHEALTVSCTHANMKVTRRDFVNLSLWKPPARGSKLFFDLQRVFDHTELARDRLTYYEGRSKSVPLKGKESLSLDGTHMNEIMVNTTYYPLICGTPTGTEQELAVLKRFRNQTSHSLLSETAGKAGSILDFQRLRVGLDSRPDHERFYRFVAKKSTKPTKGDGQVRRADVQPQKPKNDSRALSISWKANAEKPDALADPPTEDRSSKASTTSKADLEDGEVPSSEDKTKKKKKFWKKSKDKKSAKKGSQGGNPTKTGSGKGSQKVSDKPLKPGTNDPGGKGVGKEGKKRKRGGHGKSGENPSKQRRTTVEGSNTNAPVDAPETSAMPGVENTPDAE